MEMVMGNPKAKGRDRWGYFYDMTGYEAKGQCFWCGCETRKRYCCPGHNHLYHETYVWIFASGACFKKHAYWGRAGREYYWHTIGAKCHDCKGIFENEDIEIHHIIPLNGERRDINVLNRPNNLIALCRDCHNKRRREWNYLMKRYNECEQIVKADIKVVDEQQLLLF